MNTLLHIPVLPQEVLDGLNVQPGKRYIDATVGAGGHARLILERGGYVLGIDQDQEAIQNAHTKLSEYVEKTGINENRFRLFHGPYSRMKEYVSAMDWGMVDGILMDIGMSSMQLDDRMRGFSIRYKDAPLDMRMDGSNGLTASDIVQSYSEDQLYEIFSTFGEEEHSRSITHAIVSKRRINPIHTVGELIETISHAGTGMREDTVIRIFQALRIEVNGELMELREGLRASEALLTKGGRLVVISFHSLEDRIVKQALRQRVWNVITKKPIRASESELKKNSRSRSAKLRIAEKI